MEEFYTNFFETIDEKVEEFLNEKKTQQNANEVIEEANEGDEDDNADGNELD